MGCEIHGNLILCRPDLEGHVLGRTRKALWCFSCRKRAVHLRILLVEKLKYDEKGELVNGYYEPLVRLECPTCGEDNTQFPRG